MGFNDIKLNMGYISPAAEAIYKNHRLIKSYIDMASSTQNMLHKYPVKVVRKAMEMNNNNFGTAMKNLFVAISISKSNPLFNDSMSIDMSLNILREFPYNKMAAAIKNVTRMASINLPAHSNIHEIVSKAFGYGYPINPYKSAVGPPVLDLDVVTNTIKNKNDYTKHLMDTFENLAEESKDTKKYSDRSEGDQLHHNVLLEYSLKLLRESYKVINVISNIQWKKVLEIVYKIFFILNMSNEIYKGANNYLSNQDIQDPISEYKNVSPLNEQKNGEEIEDKKKVVPNDFSGGERT